MKRTQQLIDLAFKQEPDWNGTKRLPCSRLASSGTGIEVEVRSKDWFAATKPSRIVFFWGGGRISRADAELVLKHEFGTLTELFWFKQGEAA